MKALYQNSAVAGNMPTEFLLAQLGTIAGDYDTITLILLLKLETPGVVAINHLAM